MAPFLQGVDEQGLTSMEILIEKMVLYEWSYHSWCSDIELHSMDLCRCREMNLQLVCSYHCCNKESWRTHSIDLQWISKAFSWHRFNGCKRECHPYQWEFRSIDHRMFPGKHIASGSECNRTYIVHCSCNSPVDKWSPALLKTRDRMKSRSFMIPRREDISIRTASVVDLQQVDPVYSLEHWQ